MIDRPISLPELHTLSLVENQTTISGRDVTPQIFSSAYVGL